MKFLICFFFLLSSLNAAGSPAGFKVLPKAIPKKSKVIKASFELTWERYPSPDMILNYMASSFPFNYEVGNECQVLSDLNRDILGDNNTSMGAPVVNKPNSAFVVWYMGCLQSMLKDEKINIQRPPSDKQAQVLSYLGKSLVESCIKKNPSLKRETFFTAGGLYFCLWRTFSTAEKKQKIKEQISSFVGPDEVLQDLRIASSADELADKILLEIENYEKENDNRYQFIVTDQELTLLNVAQITKFLLMLLDTMKY